MCVELEFGDVAVPDPQVLHPLIIDLQPPREWEVCHENFEVVLGWSQSDELEFGEVFDIDDIVVLVSDDLEVGYGGVDVGVDEGIRVHVLDDHLDDVLRVEEGIDCAEEGLLDD